MYLPFHSQPSRSNRCDKKVATYWGCGIFWAAVIVGFGISEIVIWNGRHDYLSNSTACPTYPANLTYFEMQKDIWSQWKWEYEYQSPLSGKVEQVCPSTTHDARVILNGKTVAQTDGKIVATVSKTYINDCHGDCKFVVRTGNLFETIINGNRIWVSYEVRAKDGNTQLAYVEGTHFFSDSIDIKAASSGNRIAHMSRNKITLSEWKWKITIYDTEHPASDPALLSAIAGKKSFSDKDSDGKDKSDMCNGYFWGVAYLFLAIAIVIGIMIYYLIMFESL